MSKTLQFPARREMLTGEAVQQYLASITTPLTEFQSICLSDKSYGLDAASAITPILSQLTSLTHADLSDVIAAQKTEDATEVLRTITESLCVHASLTSLDLSHNAMGLRGIEAIQRLLCERRDSLNHLYLNNCGYESNAIAHLHRCLLPETDSTTQLRSLQVGRNRFGGSGGCAEVTKIVARSPELTNLRVSSTSSPADEIRVLVETLLGMPNLRLTSLDLGDHSFASKENRLALIQLLQSPQCSTLQHLSLSMLKLGTEGLRLVCRTIRHSTAPLKSLDLSTSDANASATPALAAALLSKPTLETVHLDYNFFRLTAGDLVLRTLSALPNLHAASLRGTQLNSTSVPGALALIRAVGARGGAIKLNLDHNYFSDDGVEQLLEAAEDHRVPLGPFDFNDPSITEEDYDEENEDVEDTDQHEMQMETAMLRAATAEIKSSAAAVEAAVADLTATVQNQLNV